MKIRLYQKEGALYPPRRGESDKAYMALGSATTLSQLYPERKFFHVSEQETFSYVMSWYWIQKGGLDQAKMHLKIIQKNSPQSDWIEDLIHKMRRLSFDKLIKKSLNKT